VRLDCRLHRLPNLFFKIIIPIWLLGFNFFFYHAISLYIFFKYRKSFNKLSPIAFILLIFSMIYMVSLVFSFAYFKYDLERYVSSIYNLSYWLMGFIIFNFYSKENKINVIEISRNASVFIYVSFIIAIFSYFLTRGGTTTVGYESLLGYILPDGLPTLITDSSKLKFFNVDWLNGEKTVRFSGMGIYPTASAWIFFLGLFSLMFFSDEKINKIKIVTIAISIFLIAITASRIVLFSSVILVFLFINKKLIFSKYIYLIFFVVSIISTLLLVFLQSIDFFDAVLSARQGSTDLRFLLYQMTYDTAMNVSPILGIGVKPRILGLEIPLGSHNSFLGILLRTGFVGLISFFVLLMYMIFYFFKNIKIDGGYAGLCLTIATIPILAFEDLDAPQVVCFGFFLLLACCNNRIKWA
jgi:O-antigen ligase